MEIYWLILAIAAAFFVAWNNGSNNAANAIGTVVGLRALTLKKALVISAIFEFIGALLFGRFVSMTIMKGIINVSVIQSGDIIIKGMIAALLATGIWVLVASWFRIPMSISEGIVGGVIGFGLVSAGISMINWGTVLAILSAWFILPLFSALVAIALYHFYERLFKKTELLPLIVTSSLFLMVTSTVFLLLVRTTELSDLIYVIGLSSIAGFASIFLYMVYDRMVLKPKPELVKRDESIKILLLVSAASMAFSHGAHDVANSAGPLSAVLTVFEFGFVPEHIGISGWALIFGAAGIAIGIVTWGSQVVKTIGEEITTLSYSSAFTAQLSASLSVLIITRLGLPVSTTIAIVGAVAGVGLAKGFRAVNSRVLAKIFGAWVVALPAVIGMAAGIYLLFEFIS
jgi:PiT family inorganic phosphate transporter